MVLLTIRMPERQSKCKKAPPTVVVTKTVASPPSKIISMENSEENGGPVAGGLGEPEVETVVTNDLYTKIFQLKDRPTILLPTSIHDKKCDAFRELATMLFKAADMNQDGLLNFEEFRLLVYAPSIELDLSLEEVRKLKDQCDVNRDGFISFSEFLPLAQELLCMFCAKNFNSATEWHEFEASSGKTIYFNKVSGEASYIIPSDYEMSMLDFRNMYDDALMMYLLEASPVGKKSNHVEYEGILHVLRSVFCIYLTEDDCGEIRTIFQTDGENQSLPVQGYLPIAKRIIQLLVGNGTPDIIQWCQLLSPHYGVFWMNKNTGEFRRHAPHSYVRFIQSELLSRRKEAAAIPQINQELADYKQSFTDEQKRSKDLTEKLYRVQDAHLKVTDDIEKHGTQLHVARKELTKKSDQLKNLQKEHSTNREKIEHLEDKVVETEKLYSQLEHTREILRGSQRHVRERDADIRKLNSTLEDTERNLTQARATIEELNRRVEDLNNQVREEVKKLQMMELELESLPKLQNQLKTSEEKLTITKREAAEKSALLQLARKTIKENKDTIHKLEKELEQLPIAERELKLSTCEIWTLKQLIAGKDALVLQRTHDLDLLRDTLDDLEKHRRASFINNELFYTKIQGLRSINTNDIIGPTPKDKRTPKTRSMKPPSQSLVSASATVHMDLTGSTKSSMTDLKIIIDKNDIEKDITNTRKQESSLSNSKVLSPNKQIRPKTAIVRPSIVPNGLHHRNRPGSSFSSASFSVSNQLVEPTYTGEDLLASRILHIGDRIVLKKSKTSRHGKYGGEMPATGTVKFLGTVDRRKTDHRLYIGIKMDEPIGDTDGLVNGKRFFSVPPRHGKLVRVPEVASVLEPKTGMYKPLQQFMKEHLTSVDS